MKYTAIEKELPAHELEADFERAQKIEKWRIGEKALFQTNGLFSIKYLPLSSKISSIIIHHKGVSARFSDQGRMQLRRNIPVEGSRRSI